ncbi:MAG: hypothetical protein U0521_17345 [Anaerolineae bacterium]
MADSTAMKVSSNRLAFSQSPDADRGGDEFLKQTAASRSATCVCWPMMVASVPDAVAQGFQIRVSRALFLILTVSFLKEGVVERRTRQPDQRLQALDILSA